MRKKLTTLAFTGTIASALTVMVVADAQAVTITLNSQNYEIATVEGDFLELSESVERTPWWEDEAVAFDVAGQFAALCQDGCLPNEFEGVALGPLFAYALQAPIGTIVYETYDETLDASFAGEIPATRSGTYAIVSSTTPIPEPLTILGSVAAVGFGVVMKRRLADSNH